MWRAPHTSYRDRKPMRALVIENVTLVKQREITAAVRLHGGATTTLPRPLTAQQMRASHDNVLQHIELLLREYTDAQAARMLNERGPRTGAGDAFDTGSIKWVRCAATIKASRASRSPPARCQPHPRSASSACRDGSKRASATTTANGYTGLLSRRHQSPRFIQRNNKGQFHCGR